MADNLSCNGHQQRCPAAVGLSFADQLLPAADMVEALIRSMEDDRPSTRPPAAKYAIQQLKAYRYQKADRKIDLQCSVCQ